MANSVLSAPHFKDEAAAFAYVESKLWPNGPVCPHCGEIERIGELKGKTTRLGLRKCYACKKPFTVRMGTIFESSHLALHLWLQVIHLMCASKKGISTRQIQRMLRCSMKTAWFLTHRIREAMASGETLPPMGGTGAVVEADETYVGGQRRGRNALGRQFGIADKMKVVSLVERGGSVRSFRVDTVNNRTIHAILRKNVAKNSALMTDEAYHYRVVGKEFTSHGRVEHNANQYVNGDIHTNTIERYFSIFKRGMKGVYQHCREKHLHRYLAEFDFRYNNREAVGSDDVIRAEAALEGVKGKRLTYRTTHRP